MPEALIDAMKAERAPRPRYVVTVQPVNGQRPDGVRLRRMLKEIGRRHGLRCIDVREEAGPPESAAAKRTPLPVDRARANFHRARTPDPPGVGAEKNDPNRQDRTQPRCVFSAEFSV